MKTTEDFSMRTRKDSRHAKLIPAAVLLTMVMVLLAGNAAAYPITIITQSDPPGLPTPTVSMDGGVTDIPPGGNASFWVNPPEGWEYTRTCTILAGMA